MRPVTLADLVAEAIRRAGEPVLEIVWGWAYGTCEVRTAAGWRRVYQRPRGGPVDVRVTGAREIDRPRCYEAWYEGGDLEEFDGV